MSQTPVTTIQHYDKSANSNAVRLAMMIMEKIKSHRTDLTSLFQPLDSPEMDEVRKMLFFCNQELYETITLHRTDPKPPFVPDSTLLQSIHAIHLQLAEDLSACTTGNNNLEKKDSLADTIQKFVLTDVRNLIYLLSKASSRPYKSPQQVKPMFCCGIAGYDTDGNHLMSYVNRQGKQEQSSAQPNKKKNNPVVLQLLDAEEKRSIRKQICSRKDCREYKPPTYPMIVQRFSIAEKQRHRRSPDGQANRQELDSIQWCLEEILMLPTANNADASPESHICTETDLQQHDSNNYINKNSFTNISPIVEDRAIDNHHDDNDTYAHPEMTNIIPGKRSLPFRHATMYPNRNILNPVPALEERHNQPKTKPRKRRKKAPSKNPPASENSQPPDPSNNPAINEGQITHAQTDCNVQSESNQQVDTNNTFAVSAVPEVELNSHRSQTGTDTDELRITTHHVNSVKLPTGLLLQKNFLDKFYAHGIILQAISVDGRSIRHGHILPKMHIERLTATKLPDKVDDDIYPTGRYARIPLPGDIVDGTEAKKALGFSDVSTNWNSVDGSLGLNSIFISNASMVQDYESVKRIQEDMTNRSKDLAYAQSSNILASSIHIVAATNKHACNRRNNQVLIDAALDSRLVSVWAPTLSALLPEGETESASSTERNCLRSDSCITHKFQLLGMYTVSSFSYHDPTFPHAVDRNLVFGLSPSPPHTHTSDIRQSTEPMITTIVIHQSLEDTSQTPVDQDCAALFDTMLSTTVMPPLYLQSSALDLMRQFPCPTIRKALSLSLLRMMANLDVIADEPTHKTFQRNLQNMSESSFHLTFTTTLLRSLIGDLLFCPRTMANLYDTIIPSKIIVASEKNASALAYIENQCRGCLKKLSDAASIGLTKLIKHEIEGQSRHHNKALKVVKNGARVIHYRPFGQGAEGKQISQWNNCDDYIEADDDIRTFISELQISAKLASGTQEIEFDYFANYLSNFVLPGEHPEPQIPHCDTSDKFREESTNDQNDGCTNVLTVFVADSEDGSMVCVWPIRKRSCTEPLNPDEMKVIYLPKGYFLVINGDVYHAGGMCFGETPAGKYDPFLSMRNGRFQAFMIPRTMKHLPNVDRTLLIPRPERKVCFHYQTLQWLKFYLLSGDVSMYTFPENVQVFMDEFKKNQYL